MRNYARIAIILGVLVVILLISPLIIGLYLEHQYQNLLDAYNVTEKLNVRVDSFHRGWFHSVATLRVKILDPKILEYMNLSDQDRLAHEKFFVLDQSIQHGPIFYHDIKELPYFIGLITIQNKIRSTAEMSKVVNVIKDVDYVSFMGNCHKYFKLSSMNLVYPKTDVNIKIDMLEGDAWVLVKQKKVQVSVRLQDMMFYNSDILLLIPSVNWQFDHDTRLWFGNDVLTIPSISVIENGNTTINMTGFYFKGSSEMIDEMMSGNKEIFVHQINIGDYQAGPFHFNLSIDKFNAKAVEDMIEAYNLIMERGELYQSQLIQKMIMMLPQVFNKGTAISLKDLDLKTQDGQLHMNGKLVWNTDKEFIPDQINDIIFDADVKIYLKIAKPLMYRWIDIASNLPWFNQISSETDQFYNFAYHEMILTKQLNAFGVLDLVRQGRLRDRDAKILLALQRANASRLDYGITIKELWLNKIISHETSYILLYLYTESQAPLDYVRFLLEQNQQKIAQSMILQLDNWIKSGYIQQQQNDYIVSFVQQKNHMKFNERPVP